MRLTEVFIQGNKSPKQDDFVISYKQNIWVIDEDNYANFIPILNQQFHTDFDSDSSFWDVSSTITEKSEDDINIIAGQIDNGYLAFYTNETIRHSTASPTMKKVLNKLHLKGVNIRYYHDSGDDVELIEDRHKYLKPLKSKDFYHGTSLNYFDSIARLGIKSTGQTNFRKIKHEDKVFITLNKEKSEFHAIKSAENNNSFPISLVLNIPDQDKLVLDYDVALSVYGRDHPDTIKLGYRDINLFAKNNYRGFIETDDVDKIIKKERSKPESLNTKIGIFGYIGRIPASFITGVLVDTEKLGEYLQNELFGDNIDLGTVSSIQHWELFTIKELKDHMNDRINEYELELIGEDDDE